MLFKEGSRVASKKDGSLGTIKHVRPHLPLSQRFIVRWDDGAFGVTAESPREIRHINEKDAGRILTQ